MTFSLIGRCEKTNMVGVVISSSSISVASRCPWVRAGVGAASTQNVTDPSLGNLMLDYLEKGLEVTEVIDKIIKEPLGGAHRNFDQASSNLSKVILKSLDELTKLPINSLVEKRYERLMGYGSI